MKKFEFPVVNVVLFNVEDVITTSNGGDDYIEDPNQTPGI